jgi:hypothetical protein
LSEAQELWHRKVAKRKGRKALFFCLDIITMVWKASILQACEAISFSAARILVIKKGL